MRSRDHGTRQGRRSTAIALAVLAAAAALALAPPATLGQGAEQGQGQAQATGQTHDVTFYGHVFGNGLASPMPANTEAPVGEDNYGIGPGGSCVQACDEPGFNSLALFSTAGFVDVKNRAEFLQQGGYAQLHNERGQTKDILLDTSGNIEATIYFTMDLHGWFVGNAYGTNCLHPHPPDVPCVYPSWGWDPGIVPDVKVRATLYMANLGAHGSEASAAPPVAEAIENGDAQVIAEGFWGPDVVMNGLPGSPNVNQFVIDLGQPQLDTIPRDQDFFLVYTVYHETAGNPYVINGPMRWWGGELFPPTFDLPVQNAFDVERVIPNFAHGKLAILGVMNTPWGSYDIDPASVELTVDGPNGQVVPEHIARFGDFSVAHGGHYLPINLTWIWDYQREGLAPGGYTVTLTASNFQGSATASCTATFDLRRVGGSGSALTPGNVNEGVCGSQSASDAFLEDIREGAGGSNGG